MLSHAEQKPQSVPSWVLYQASVTVACTTRSTNSWSMAFRMRPSRVALRTFLVDMHGLSTVTNASSNRHHPSCLHLRHDQNKNWACRRPSDGPTQPTCDSAAGMSWSVSSTERASLWFSKCSLAFLSARFRIMAKVDTQPCAVSQSCEENPPPRRDPTSLQFQHKLCAQARL